ncbi:MAG: hypothetical protein HYR76_11545 [Ignavibacteria bacterium]|nr:hypothetical protein [Ignavibacteria bacterium]
MVLAALQKKLLHLLKSRYEVTAEDDAYIRSIAQSIHLGLVKEIAVWWRMLGIEQYCPLTSSLLKQQHLFDEIVKEYFNNHAISPFIETLGIAFLDELSCHQNTLIAATAQFERALIKVKLGDSACYTVDWEYHPHLVLNNILTSNPDHAHYTRGLYRTIISARYPHLFEVQTIHQEAAIGTH